MISLIKKDIKSSFPKNLENETIEKDSFDNFKKSLEYMLSNVKNKSEEYNKKHINNFLRDTFYNNDFKVNVDLNKIDSAIFNKSDKSEKPIVIIETKKLKSNDMINQLDANKKSMHQLILYYLNEIESENQNTEYLIITDGFEWYIFKEIEFRLKIKEDPKIKEIYKKNKNSTKESFYNHLNDYLNFKSKKIELECVYFNLEKYSFIDDGIFSEPNEKREIPESLLIDLYHFFSPENLVHKPFISDSNSLNREFYNELLHIIGLEEKKVDGKKVLQRASNKLDYSILENTIDKLIDKGYYSNKKEDEEKLFESALELSITWINRILFLKLLESQLRSIHSDKQEYKFLSSKSLDTYDKMNDLFFKVLAIPNIDRKENLRKQYSHIPYLNSALFELSEAEIYFNIDISQLNNDYIEIYKQSILKHSDNYQKENKNKTLTYLLNFLDAFDYSNISKEKVLKKKKTIINAAVLGLIFEKINGYKEGSFFTPGLITMYMCKESIRLAIIKKFNQKYNWNIQDFTHLRNTLIDYRSTEKIIEFNELINETRICDPAVGSGHFLVSALNELIVAKYELGILIDDNHNRITDYIFKIENDELIILKPNSEIFIYKIENTNPITFESQKLQETIFHEKETLIENCLFGVDINSKSVQICRLRLWIELLKSAYYTKDSNYFDLETLPNIDINIKTGNSLLSKFDIIDETISVQDRKTLDEYKILVSTYKTTDKREVRKSIKNTITIVKKNFKGLLKAKSSKAKEIENLTQELTVLLNQSNIFEFTKSQLKHKEKLEEKITKLNDEQLLLQESEIYNSAFEWRYEFPEVLNDDGKFVGFDLIIGNPPYIQLQKNSGILANSFQNEGYETFERTGDIYALFYEKAYELLNENGFLCFITSNKWMRAGYGEKLRKFLSEKTKPIKLIDFGGNKIFASATVDTNILIYQKSLESKYKFLACNINDNIDLSKPLGTYLKDNFIEMPKVDNQSWIIANEIEYKIKNKIETNGIPLKDWNLNIYRGILTGFNEAFIIDGKKKNELIAKDPKNIEVLKPMLRGRDIQKYKVEFADLWLINTHNGIKNKNIKGINIYDYPDIKEHLEEIEEFRVLGHLGENAQNSNGLYKRDDCGDTPYNLRNCAYLDEFSKKKIVYNDINQQLTFSIVEPDVFFNNTVYFISNNSYNNYLISVLNSKLINWFFRFLSVQLGEHAVRMFSIYVKLIPIPKITLKQQKPFINLVDKIISDKSKGIDTATYEKEIDEMVYQLYELTPEEIAIVEGRG